MKQVRLSQKGLAHILILIAAFGVIIFLLISSFASFKNKLFSTLFPKPPSHAATTTDTSYNLGILVIKYFPLTSDGQNIDINITGDVGDSYTVIKQRTVDVTNNLKSSLEKATSYLGYEDLLAQPSLTYTIVGTKEYTQAVPMDSSTRKPLYNQILTNHNICDYVDSQNVKEVWMWAYQGPTFPGSSYPYLNISESKMAGPFGDISNSDRAGDMPICQYTYRLYVFNYGRYTAEAMESWGHQIEAELDVIDETLFRDEFQGSNYPQTLEVNGRCGSVHNPPNARFEYDRANLTSQKSDCLDWNPDSLGTLSDISCQNWGCADLDPLSSNASLNYMIWNWQNLPGKNNSKSYQDKNLRNFWDVHGDFDEVMGNDKTLILSVSLPSPSPTPSESPSPTPSPTPVDSSTTLTPTPTPTSEPSSSTPTSFFTTPEVTPTTENQLNNLPTQSAYNTIYNRPTPSADLTNQAQSNESKKCDIFCNIDKLFKVINEAIENQITRVLERIGLLPPKSQN